MKRTKVKLECKSVGGKRLVMYVYETLLGTIYKALRLDFRVFDITVNGVKYKDYVKIHGGEVID